MTETVLPWDNDPKAGEGITLKGQLACAKRELALRKTVYPRFIAQGKMLSSKAVIEVESMAAIVQTLQRLVDAEQAQGSLFG